MSTIESKSQASASSDAMAGTKAQKYINGLYQLQQTATNNYRTQSSILASNITQQEQLAQKSEYAKAHYAQLQQNLTEAQEAEENVKKVMQFFAKQRTLVLNMVENAKSMSSNAYQSLYFLVKQGVARVEALNNLVIADNKEYAEAKEADEVASNVPVPWLSSVTSALEQAQASGEAATTAGEEAVQAAFNSYISNQSIYYRTTSYLRSFVGFQKQLRELQERLIKETSLAKYQSDLLDAQLLAADARVKSLQTLTQTKKVAMDEANKMYEAAQQGASYVAGAAG